MSARSCIIHFGFPKTGTTSIQRFLRHELADPDFLYPAFDTGSGSPDACHNRALNWAFRSVPEKFHLQAKEQLPSDVIQLKGKRCQEQLRSEVQSSTASTLILSAEELCWFKSDDLRRMIEFLRDLGLESRAFAYIRTFKDYQESRFQQSLREPGPLNLNTPQTPDFFRIHYKRSISLFDSLLAESNVSIAMFEPGIFGEGGVVHHFCNQLGIKAENISRRLLNESLSADALKLLYAYRLRGAGHGVSPWSKARRFAFTRPRQQASP